MNNGLINYSIELGLVFAEQKFKKLVCGNTINILGNKLL